MHFRLLVDTNHGKFSKLQMILHSTFLLLQLQSKPAPQRIIILRQDNFSF